jgi:hypothetical protein
MNLRDEQAAMRARQEYVRKKRKEKSSTKTSGKESAGMEGKRG